MLITVAKSIKENRSSQVHCYLTYEEIKEAFGQLATTKSATELSRLFRVDAHFVRPGSNGGGCLVLKFATDGHYKLGVSSRSVPHPLRVSITDKQEYLKRQNLSIRQAPTTVRQREIVIPLPDHWFALGPTSTPAPTVGTAPPVIEMPRQYVDVKYATNFEDELETAIGMLNDVLKTRPKETSVVFKYNSKHNVVRCEVTKPRIIGG